MTTYLYRHFDADGRLLYVGVTSNISKRNGEHLRQSGWRDRIARITHQEFASRDAAIQAEADVISSEWPEFNKNGSGKNGVACMFRIRADLSGYLAKESAATNINKTRLVELALGNYFAVKR